MASGLACRRGKRRSLDSLTSIQFGLFAYAKKTGGKIFFSINVALRQYQLMGRKQQREKQNESKLPVMHCADCSANGDSQSAVWKVNGELHFGFFSNVQ